MRRAIELSLKGRGWTSPNPCVGAVIVKGDKIVAEGWHKKAGENHAEIVAIKKCSLEVLKDSTMYVTLEPCSHIGKTNSCAEAIVKVGIKKVYVGMKDPFKKVNGKGIYYLKKNKVDVELCSLQSDFFKEINFLNQPFLKCVKKSMPYVVLKSGMTLDGKIATGDGDSKWITSKISRMDARVERSLCDAVLVGFNTVKLDNPLLAPIPKYSKKKFLRVVIDPKLDLDLKHKIFRDKNVFVACCDLASSAHKKKFLSAGVEFKSFGKEDVSLNLLLSFLLKEKDVQSIFVEGGSATNGLFFDNKLVDKIIFYIAPKLLGGKDNLSVIGGDGILKVAKSVLLKEIKIDRIGKDFKVEGFSEIY